MKITRKMLKDRCAFDEMLEWFSNRFPDGAEMQDVLDKIKEERKGSWQLWLAWKFRLTGTFEAWWDGLRWKRINYKKGKWHGLYEEWYVGGQPFKRINYKNGERHGLFERWDENGQLWVRCNYRR